MLLRSGAGAILFLSGTQNLLLTGLRTTGAAALERYIAIPVPQGGEREATMRCTSILQF